MQSNRCDDCQLDFTTKSDFKDHMLQIHNTTVFTCDLCLKVYNSKEDFKQHFDKDHKTEFNRHICSYCGVSYKWYEFLKKHIKDKHQMSVKQDCPYCGEEYYNAVAFGKHVKLKHEGMTKWNFHPCRKCHRQFNSKLNLALHNKFDHGRRGKFLYQRYVRKVLNVPNDLLEDHRTCVQCSLKFSSSIYLIKHLKMTHSEPRFYNCCRCDDAVYNTKAGVGIHLFYDHNVPRDHWCKICRIPTNFKRGLKKDGPPEIVTDLHEDKPIVPKKEDPEWAKSYVIDDLPLDVELEDATANQVDNLKHNIRHLFKILSTIPTSKLKSSKPEDLSVISISKLSSELISDCRRKNHSNEDAKNKFTTTVIKLSKNKNYSDIKRRSKTLNKADNWKPPRKESKEKLVKSKNTGRKAVIDKITCQHCNEKFMSKGKLDEHIIKHHKNLEESENEIAKNRLLEDLASEDEVTITRSKKNVENKSVRDTSDRNLKTPRKRPLKVSNSENCKSENNQHSAKKKARKSERSKITVRSKASLNKTRNKSDDKTDSTDVDSVSDDVVECVDFNSQSKDIIDSVEISDSNDDKESADADIHDKIESVDINSNTNGKSESVNKSVLNLDDNVEYVEVYILENDDLNDSNADDKECSDVTDSVPNKVTCADVDPNFDNITECVDESNTNFDDKTMSNDETKANDKLETESLHISDSFSDKLEYEDDVADDVPKFSDNIDALNESYSVSDYADVNDSFFDDKIGCVEVSISEYDNTVEPEVILNSENTIKSNDVAVDDDIGCLDVNSNPKNVIDSNSTDKFKPDKVIEPVDVVMTKCKDNIEIAKRSDTKCIDKATPLDIIPSSKSDVKKCVQVCTKSNDKKEKAGVCVKKIPQTEDNTKISDSDDVKSINTSKPADVSNSVAKKKEMKVIPVRVDTGKKVCKSKNARTKSSNKFMCKICNTRFENQVELLDHLTSKHLSPEKSASQYKQILVSNQKSDLHAKACDKVTDLVLYKSPENIFGIENADRFDDIKNSTEITEKVESIEAAEPSPAVMPAKQSNSKKVNSIKTVENRPVVVISPVKKSNSKNHPAALISPTKETDSKSHPVVVISSAKKTDGNNCPAVVISPAKDTVTKIPPAVVNSPAKESDSVKRPVVINPDSNRNITIEAKTPVDNKNCIKKVPDKENLAKTTKTPNKIGLVRKKPIVKKIILFKCLKCGERFTEKPKLINHIKAKHTFYQKLYRCDQCSEVFKTEDKLSDHVISKHPKLEEKNLPVIKIKKTDLKIAKSDLPSFLSKIISNSILNNSMMSCKICYSCFPSKELLHRHMQWEHTKNVNLHKCGQCGEILYSVKELEMHMNTAHSNCEIIKWKKQIAKTYEQQADVSIDS